MKKTTNTEEKERNLDWLLGGNPSAIKQQEAQGQEELVASQQLPRKCNSPHGVNAAEQYAKMGIKVFTSSKGDDLFLGVKLPEGWKKEATDHSMWNNLRDEKGRIRARFFYKAAFYDRDSFINFNTRYISIEEYANLDKPNDYSKYYCVKDQSTGEILFKTEITTKYSDEKLSQEADNWLNEHFPNHADLNAYWD